ncbi:MAG: hypothetical protein WAW13_00765 [Minisyncoccia bacterium]
MRTRDVFTIRCEKRIPGASQDLEQLLRKVYSFCKKCLNDEGNEAGGVSG